MALYHSSKGPVDYTIVGNPTITDGIASGFSTSNYLIATQAYPTEITSYEKNIRFNWANSAGTYQALFGGAGYDRIIFSSETYCLLSMRTSSGALMDMQVGYLPVTVGNWYVLNTKFADSIVTVKLLSDEGTVLFTKTFNFDYINSPNITPRIGQSSPDGGGFFAGSIDLNETYIKVNGQPWFGVCPVEVQKHQLKGPVGYTVVGSPTIVDGVASGFSGSNYIRTSSNAPSNFPKEITTTFNWTSYASAGRRVVGWSNGSVSVSGSHYISIVGFDAEGNYSSLNGSTYFDYNTWYTVKVLMETNKTSVYVKSGNDWVLDFSADVGFVIPDRNITFGHVSSSNFFQGSIDLNNTYIKVNGKLWFYQPADTKYIVKDGKLVWADPRIYLQSQSSANEVRPYIDTGYIPTVNTTYKWTAQFLINAGFMFGANSGDVIQNRAGHNYASSKDFVWTAIGYSNKNYEVGTTFFSKYTSHTDANGNCYLNGTNVGKMTAVAGETTKHIWLFGSSANDDSETYVTSGTRGYSARIYNFKLYESGLLVRDFVPVPAGLVIGNFTVPSNGMFDIVNQQFYGKVGSSLYDFTIGRDE